ncbi:GntR family transcriptional regulator [Nocardioides insulae]|uniref:GntR family transcriptional regulator n=1 Tax=Nocardioides insulae TaxID=394734 RepID=UPI00048CE783|nr:GntR family transcriptional regulator [Nocardioides insulae]
MSDPHSPLPAPLTVEPPSTVAKVTAELRRRIFEGELEGGSPIREVALADALGVARSTVREALTVLVAEGLATRAPHRGVTVARPEAGSVRDVCRARLVLEGAGVGRWASAPEASRAAVREALTAYTRAVADGGSYQELNERHLAFHVSLVGLTGSPRLVAMEESLVGELKVALAQVARLRRNAHDQADTHLALLDLLEDGDTESAQVFLTDHLAGAEMDILEALDLC